MVPTSENTQSKHYLSELNVSVIMAADIRNVTELQNLKENE